MIGTNTEKDFRVEEYENFYEHHNFQPMGREDAFAVHEVIPRFGWAFDVIGSLPHTGPLKVLDLGCLEGSFVLTICKHWPWVEGTGVDLTADGIEIAKTRAQEELLPAVFYQGTVEAWLQNFIDDGEKFDVVTNFELMEHVKDPELVFKLMAQVVKPGGTILVSTPSFESPYFGMDDEQNKCHIRLYTTADEDYEAVNKYGTKRTGTAIVKQLKKAVPTAFIEDIEVVSELINLRYHV